MQLQSGRLFYRVSFASIDKGTRGSAGRKCPHTASKPLRIHKVFSAAFSLSASISAPAELLRIGQPWIFEGFLFFWTQAGCRPPRRKGQKAPKRLAVRRVCSCQSTLRSANKTLKIRFPGTVSRICHLDAAGWHPIQFNGTHYIGKGERRQCGSRQPRSLRKSCP